MPKTREPGNGENGETHNPKKYIDHSGRRNPFFGRKHSREGLDSMRSEMRKIWGSDAWEAEVRKAIAANPDITFTQLHAEVGRAKASLQKFLKNNDIILKKGKTRIANRDQTVVDAILRIYHAGAKTPRRIKEKLEEEGIFEDVWMVRAILSENGIRRHRGRPSKNS